jgi:hypothetical protein
MTEYFFLVLLMLVLADGFCDTAACIGAHRRGVAWYGGGLGFVVLAVVAGVLAYRLG